MSVLVDSSVWIDYFRSGRTAESLEFLIEQNLVLTNDLILSELLPALTIQKQNRLVVLLRQLAKNPVRIDWENIIRLQTTCLRHGINKVGIPDLIIAQHVLQYDLRLLTHDKHFALLARHFRLLLY